MKLKKKLKPKLINELIDIKESRGDILSFSQNYLVNLFERHEFVSNILENYKKKKLKGSKTVYIGVGLYLSSLVTCWETFFRDVFVFICNVDTNIKEKVLKFLEEKNISEKELTEKGLSVEDFMSKQFNFQDLNDTCRAFNFLFDETKEKITDYLYEVIDKTPLCFYSPNAILLWMQEKEDLSVKIFDVLQEAFEIRHKVSHDANYLFKFRPEQMTFIEDCFFVFPQLFSIFISIKYSHKMIVTVGDNLIALTSEINENNYPVIFSSRDFEAKWYIVD